MDERLFKMEELLEKKNETKVSELEGRFMDLQFNSTTTSTYTFGVKTQSFDGTRLRDHEKFTAREDYV